MAKRKLKINFKDYFSFSNGERTGLIVLILLIALTVLVKFVVHYAVPPQPKIDVSKFEKEIARFEKVSDSLTSSVNRRYITNDSFSHKRVSNTFTPKTKVRIEINTADSAALERLPGIGKILASRIIKYRNKLGGFYSLDQLNEVYNLKSETIRLIEPFLLADTTKIKKIAINSASFKEVNAHPYLSFEQTRLIFKIRTRKRFSSLAQLVQASILTDKELANIKPYLSLE
ncbi:MAG: helix-hairpin-helix domain-containing protein [Bacteroidota bacterium]|nr:helix-hairpin-helix domain-containing protein [Bacteroidota bacterium]